MNKPSSVKSLGAFDKLLVKTIIELNGSPLISRGALCTVHGKALSQLFRRPVKRVSSPRYITRSDYTRTDKRGEYNLAVFDLRGGLNIA